MENQEIFPCLACSAAGQRLVYGWLEASNVFHWHVLTVSRLHVLAQDPKDLIVDDLELADSVNHFLQRLENKKRSDIFILAKHLRNNH